LIGQSDPGFRGLVMLLQWQHAPCSRENNPLRCAWAGDQIASSKSRMIGLPVRASSRS